MSAREPAEPNKKKVRPAEKTRWPSGDDICLPQQIKPSLSSADEIEEPQEPVRKVKIKTKSVRKKRKTMVERIEDSDDDFR
jgi:hypothetical protein